MSKRIGHTESARAPQITLTLPKVHAESSGKPRRLMYPHPRSFVCKVFMGGKQPKSDAQEAMSHVSYHGAIMVDMPCTWTLATPTWRRSC